MNVLTSYENRCLLLYPPRFEKVLILLTLSTILTAFAPGTHDSR
jgi:hypothetical protein